MIGLVGHVDVPIDVMDEALLNIKFYCDLLLHFRAAFFFFDHTDSFRSMISGLQLSPPNRMVADEMTDYISGSRFYLLPA